MIRYYTIANGTVAPADQHDGAIRAFIAPTPEEIDFLKSKRSIDTHSIHSALDPDEVSRLEMEEDHFAVIWKRPRRFLAEGTLRFAVISMGVFVFRDGVEIVISEDAPLFEGKIFHKIASYNGLVLRMLSRAITHFLDHLKAIDMLSNEIKRKINTAMENKYLLQMFDLSESLVYYLNAISSNNVVLMKLRNNAAKINLTPDDIEHLEDIQIDNNQCYKQADIFSNILTGLMDARGTVVNNNVNNLLKGLTIINTIFLPLNLLASIGGMSEYSEWTRSMSWQLAYILFMVAMVIIGGVMYITINPSTVFKRKRN